MRHLLAILTLAGLAAPAYAGEAPPAVKPDPLVKVQQLLDSRAYLEAIKGGMAVAASAEEPAEQRLKAFRLVADAYATIACPRMAIATLEQALIALGREPRYAAEAWYRIASIHQKDEEYERAARILERAAAEVDLKKVPFEQRADLLNLLGLCREALNQPRAALAAYETLASLADKPNQLATSLARAARLYASLYEFDKALACLAPLDDKLTEDAMVQDTAKAYRELIDKSTAAGRTQEARSLCRKALALFARRDSTTAHEAITRLFDLAESDAAAMDTLAGLGDAEVQVITADPILDRLVDAASHTGRAADLIRACTRAMLASPFDDNAAQNCLTAIARLHLREGRTDDALAAAAASYATAGFGYSSAARFSRAVEFVARALRSRDGHLVTGNLFRQYQLGGPDGPDGRPGTPDDIPNPLAGVALKPNPDLDKLYEAALAAQPLTTDGHRNRAWVYLLWCKPKQALSEFKREFALCSLDGNDFARAAQDVAVGLKAINGTPVGMDLFARFQRYGPEGPDGKPGTADDLKDPLAGY